MVRARPDWGAAAFPPRRPASTRAGEVHLVAGPAPMRAQIIPKQTDMDELYEYYSDPGRPTGSIEAVRVVIF